jgi:hypothetical protein
MKPTHEPNYNVSDDNPFHVLIELGFMMHDQIAEVGNDKNSVVEFLVAGLQVAYQLGAGVYDQDNHTIN